jgi:hypothetical protein
MPQIHSLPRAELEARLRTIAADLAPFWLTGILDGDSTFEDTSGDLYELAGSGAAERPDAGFFSRASAVPYLTRAVPPRVASSEEADHDSEEADDPESVRTLDAGAELLAHMDRRAPHVREDPDADLVTTVNTRAARAVSQQRGATSSDPSADLCSLIASRI